MPKVLTDTRALGVTHQIFALRQVLTRATVAPIFKCFLERTGKRRRSKEARMAERTRGEQDAQKVMLEQAQAQLIEVFRKMPHEVPLFLFTRQAHNDAFSDAARQLIRSIREITSKVSLLEFELSHERARKYDVTHAPTLLFDPERYHVRWLGAPVGEEGGPL